MLNLLLQYPIFRKCLILIILVDDKNIPSCKTCSLGKTHQFPPQDLDPLICLHTRLSAKVKCSIWKHETVDTESRRMSFTTSCILTFVTVYMCACVCACTGKKKHPSIFFCLLSPIQLTDSLSYSKKDL